MNRIKFTQAGNLKGIQLDEVDSLFLVPLWQVQLETLEMIQGTKKKELKKMEKRRWASLGAQDENFPVPGRLVYPYPTEEGHLSPRFPDPQPSKKRQLRWAHPFPGLNRSPLTTSGESDSIGKGAISGAPPKIRRLGKHCPSLHILRLLFSTIEMRWNC